jgi:hypothetical protein
MRSFSDIVAFTCKKLTSDSRRVTSASPVAVLNLPDATCIPEEEEDYILDVGTHGRSAAEQEGFCQFQASHLILFAAFHYGKTSHVRSTGVGQHLDASQVQLDYAVRTIFLRIFPHIGSILGVHHAPVCDWCKEPRSGGDYARDFIHSGPFHPH